MSIRELIWGPRITAGQPCPSCGNRVAIITGVTRVVCPGCNHFLGYLTKTRPNPADRPETGAGK